MALHYEKGHLLHDRGVFNSMIGELLEGQALRLISVDTGKSRKSRDAVYKKAP